MSETYALYRFYDVVGQLLYVGITSNIPQRFHAHRHEKDWWTEVDRIDLRHYETRYELRQAEIKAIKEEHPLYNVVHNEGGDIPNNWHVDTLNHRFNAIESGVCKAFNDFTIDRNISTLSAIEAACEQAMSNWLNRNRDAILNAIAEKGVQVYLR